jgi:hypothetical protein
MAIVLVLFAIAASVLFTLGAVLIGSLVLGGLLLNVKWAQVFLPIFFVIIPTWVVGSIAGAVIIGQVAVQSNPSLIFLGPLGGLVLGGAAGLLLGTLGAVFWWRRASLSVRNEKALG